MRPTIKSWEASHEDTFYWYRYSSHFPVHPVIDCAQFAEYIILDIGAVSFSVRRVQIQLWSVTVPSSARDHLKEKKQFSLDSGISLNLIPESHLHRSCNGIKTTLWSWHGCFHISESKDSENGYFYVGKILNNIKTIISGPSGLPRSRVHKVTLLLSGDR